MVVIGRGVVVVAVVKMDVVVVGSRVVGDRRGWSWVVVVDCGGWWWWFEFNLHVISLVTV